MLNGVAEKIGRTANPFITRRVRPGALAYRFGGGMNASALVAQLQRQHWRGAIVGPHGSGKSTLLATLIPEIERTGRRAVHVSLHDGQRRLAAALTDPMCRDALCVLVIDGYEQLSWFARSLLQWRCRRRRFGLVVTAHAACGVPQLYRTKGEIGTVWELVRELLPPDGEWVQPLDVQQAFDAHAGNVRETLFALYDLFEARRPTAVSL